jgi:hypothetical protein
MRPVPLLKKFLAVLIVIMGANLYGQAQQPGAASNQEAVAPLRVVAVEDATAPAGWKRYQIGTPAAFSAFLPGTPQYEGKQFAPAQGSLVVRLYMTSNSTGVYGLNYIESPLGTTLDKSEAQTRTFFKSYMNGFIKGFKESLQEKGSTELETKTSAERQVKISGFDGYEQDLTIGPVQGRTQVIFLGRNVYAAIAFWNAQGPVSERTAFFNSFQIHSKR